MCNFTEERRSHLLRGGSLKSWKRCVSTQYIPRTHLATLFANVVLFLSDLFGLVPLLVGDFTVPAIEASDRFKIFYSRNLWDFFFLQKAITPLLALAALDFIYYIPENCHMHAIASYSF